MEKCKLEKNKNDINVNVPSQSNPSTINQINRNLLKKTSMQALDEKWNNIEETININKNNILSKNTSNNTQNNQPKPTRFEDTMLKGKNILNSLDEYNKNGIVINNENKDDKSNSKNKKIKGEDKNLNIKIDYKKILHAYDNEFDSFCKDKIDFFNKIKDEIYANNITLVNNNNTNNNTNNNINNLNMIFNNTFNTFNNNNNLNNNTNTNTNTDNLNNDLDINSKEYIIKKKIENLKNFDFSSKGNNNEQSTNARNNNKKIKNNIINNNISNDPYNHLNSTSITKGTSNTNSTSNSNMNTLHRKNHKNFHDKMVKYNNKSSNPKEPEIIKGKNNPLFTSNTPNNTITIVKNDKNKNQNMTNLNNLNNKLFRNYTTKRLQIDELNDDQSNNNPNIPYNSFLNMNKGLYKNKNQKKSSKIKDDNLKNINLKNDINSMITIINKSKGNRGSKSVSKIKSNKYPIKNIKLINSNSNSNSNNVNNSINALNNNNTNKSHDERFKQQIYNMCDYLKSSKKNNSNCISKRNINNNNLNINLNLNNMYNTNKNFYDKNEYSTECYFSNFGNSSNYFNNVSNDIKGMISNTFSSNYKMYDGDNNIYSVNKIGNTMNNININNINNADGGINGVNINSGNKWINESDNERGNKNKMTLLMNYSLLQKFNDNEKLITSLKLRKK